MRAALGSGQSRVELHVIVARCRHHVPWIIASSSSATWMRMFLVTHPGWQKSSMPSTKIALSRVRRWSRRSATRDRNATLGFHKAESLNRAVCESGRLGRFSNGDFGYSFWGVQWKARHWAAGRFRCRRLRSSTRWQVRGAMERAGHCCATFGDRYETTVARWSLVECSVGHYDR